LPSLMTVHVPVWFDFDQNLNKGCRRHFSKGASVSPASYFGSNVLLDGILLMDERH
jgi:hypothetical protein